MGRFKFKPCQGARPRLQGRPHAVPPDARARQRRRGVCTARSLARWTRPTAPLAGPAARSSRARCRREKHMSRPQTCTPLSRRWRARGRGRGRGWRSAAARPWPWKERMALWGQHPPDSACRAIAAYRTLYCYVLAGNGDKQARLPRAAGRVRWRGQRHVDGSARRRTATAAATPGKATRPRAACSSCRTAASSAPGPGETGWAMCRPVSRAPAAKQTTLPGRRPRPALPSPLVVLSRPSPRAAQEVVLHIARPDERVSPL